jgi:hypothetical protein
MWVYHDMAADTYVGIRFNLTGPADDPSVRAIEWFISEKTPPRTGTYVFAPGATYSLTYGAPPELPDGQRWFAVTVQPGT